MTTDQYTFYLQPLIEDWHAASGPERRRARGRLRLAIAWVRRRRLLREDAWREALAFGVSGQGGN